MKSAIFAFLGIIFYSILNVLLEEKLYKYTHASILVYVWALGIILSLVVLLTMKITGQEINDPLFNYDPKVLVLMIIFGVIYFLGDFFFVASYTSGGNLFVTVGILGLFPVVAAVMKTSWVRYSTGAFEAINMWYVAGYLLALVAAVCVAKGSTIQ